MAHLVRPWIITYVNSKGKRVKKGTPGARKVRDRARKWYAQGVPGYPPKKRIPLASDKSVALRKLAELVGKGERKEANLVDPFEEHRARPLAEHLDDYARYLSAKGDTQAHVDKTMSRCRALLKGAEDLEDLQPSA